VAIDLRHLNGDCYNEALAINSKSQVVAISFSCDGSNNRTFMWEKGSTVDLNTLIPPGSSLQLVLPMAVNDRGEIAGVGVPPGVPPPNLSTQGHAFLLIPCGKGDEGCGKSAAGPTATTDDSAARVTERPPTVTPANPALNGQGMLDRLRGRRFPWYRLGGPGTGPTN